MTVRRAISLLVEQGVVSTERGRGTYVRQLELSAATFNIDELRKLYDNAASVEVKILEVRLVPADPITAHNLAIPEGERTISLRRLLNTDGKPLFYHYEYLACDIHNPIVEAELEATSLQGLFEGTGHNLFKWGELNMRADIMSERRGKDSSDANALRRSLPDPCVLQFRGPALELGQICLPQRSAEIRYGCGHSVVKAFDNRLSNRGSKVGRRDLGDRK